MPRHLGIDYGSRRIGVAVSDPEGRLASPVATVEGAGGEAEQVSAVLKYAEEFTADAFVVGLPLNMDGSEGQQARASRRFGEALHRASGKPVDYWDERLSSFAAEELIRPAELTRKKRRKRLDRVAAQVILQSYLDSHAASDRSLNP